VVKFHIAVKGTVERNSFSPVSLQVSYRGVVKRNSCSSLLTR
jgi:hypothetical protein